MSEEPTVIAGLGVGIVAVEAVRRRLEKAGAAHPAPGVDERLEGEPWTSEELAACRRRADPAPGLAARLAAKRAAMQALGSPDTSSGESPAPEQDLAEIEILRGDSGPPRLRWHGAVAGRVRGLGVEVSHVSLSHERGSAVAVVLLSRRPGPRRAAGSSPPGSGSERTSREG